MYNISDIQDLFSTPLKRIGDKYFTNCPFHTDNSPSFSLDIRRGIWRCWGECQVWGRIEDLPDKLNRSDVTLANYDFTFTQDPKEDPKFIPDQLNSAFAEILWKNEHLLSQIRNRIPSDDVIKKFMIGYSPERSRFTIPIYEGNACKNIKLVSFTSKIKQMNFKRGYGKPRLYPQEALSSDRIIICAGEWDTLCLHSFGFPAITGTAGEGTWLDEWNNLFFNKRVFIIYDQDKAGEKARKKVANGLIGYAAEVRIVDFPQWIGDGFDVSDFFIKQKHNVSEFIQCLRSSTLVTEIFEPEPDMFDAVLPALHISSVNNPWSFDIKT